MGINKSGNKEKWENFMCGLKSWEYSDGDKKDGGEKNMVVKKGNMVK